MAGGERRTGAIKGVKVKARRGGVFRLFSFQIVDDDFEGGFGAFRDKVEELAPGCDTVFLGFLVPEGRADKDGDPVLLGSGKELLAALAARKDEQLRVELVAQKGASCSTEVTLGDGRRTPPPTLSLLPPPSDASLSISLITDYSEA